MQPTNLSELVLAVSFTDVILAILAATALILSVSVLRKAAHFLVTFIRD